MTFVVVGPDGHDLDAHFEVVGNDVVFHSRGGGKGSRKSVNTDYGPALRLLFERIRAAGLELDEVLVDSAVVSGMPPDSRRVLDWSERSLSVTDSMRLVSTRMRDVRPPGSSAAKGGNSTKRIRLRLHSGPRDRELADLLGGRPTARDLRSQSRLPAEMLRQTTAEFVWSAIERALAGERDTVYKESVDYDVITDDGERFPPKMVFGMAASEALGFHVLPEHFTGGEGTVCFEMLRAADVEVVLKGDASARQDGSIPSAPEDREAAEGSLKLRTHLVRERSPVLAKAKKSEFKRLHGQLRCEMCELDPVEMFGSTLGEACIEVHHAKTQVAEMMPGHRTRLEDLQCLCANCHRVEHARMRAELRSA